jgi:translation initiation factor 2 subunit 3
VDHGKTTITNMLSGMWTDRHSEEIRRGISIRLGYAEINLNKCPKCEEPEAFTTEKKCPKCGGATKFLREVSFVDAPGHEMLIATMLSGAALMDGVILVIAADEPCPQPQTREHLLALQILGVRNIIVVQNKIDIVDKEAVKENRKQIQEFLKKFSIDAPIIPVAANYKANKDVLIAAIQNFIPTPKRDSSKPARMYIARSFDINKPGTKVSEIQGGVVGGTLLQGGLKIGDEIEIKPGIKRIKQNQETWETIKTKIASLSTGSEKLNEAKPGGLIAVRTYLDPYLTKSDALSGNVLGAPGSLPGVIKEIECEVHLIERALIDQQIEVKVNDTLMLSVGTTVTVGLVAKQLAPGKFLFTLKLPIVAEKGARFAINKRIDMKWRLVGYGIIA